MKPFLFSTTEIPVDPDSVLREEAARWVVRRDRGFSAPEAAAFERWLQADPRHAAAIERSSVAWSLLDGISQPVVTASARKPHPILSWKSLAAAGLAAAAIWMFSFTMGWRPMAVRPDVAANAGKSIESPARSPHLTTFSDGTIVHLNVASDVVEQFTPVERRVLLVQGEAYFNVAKNPSRPFIVRAGLVEVRAVGTIFNVSLGRSTIEVLVTEGMVRVGPSGSAGESMLVQAGQHATIVLEGGTAMRGITVAEITQAEVTSALAWQDSLLKLGGATLAELAVEFERRTGHHLLMDEPSLGELRIGGRFRADDLDGFVRVLEENYGLQAERRGPGETILRHRK